MRSLFTKVRVSSAASSLLRKRVVSSSLLASTRASSSRLTGLYAAPARTMATAPKGGAKKPAAAAPAPAVAKPSPAAQLVQIKTELANILMKEREEVGGDVNADHPYSVYVQANSLNITHDQKEGVITVQKTLHGYDVVTKFNTSPDPDNEGEGEEAEDAEGKNEDEQDAEAYNYSFVVSVRSAGKADAPTMNLFAISSKDGKLYFEGLSLGAEAKMGDYPETDFNDLPTAAQDKIADFMDVLKIDDEFAQFVPAAAAETSRLGHLKQLTELHKFVDSK